jgi:hypothetical protein
MGNGHTLGHRITESMPNFNITRVLLVLLACDPHWEPHGEEALLQRRLEPWAARPSFETRASAGARAPPCTLLRMRTYSGVESIFSSKINALSLAMIEQPNSVSRPGEPPGPYAVLSPRGTRALRRFTLPGSNAIASHSSASACANLPASCSAAARPKACSGTPIRKERDSKYYPSCS